MTNPIKERAKAWAEAHVETLWYSFDAETDGNYIGELYT